MARQSKNKIEEAIEINEQVIAGINEVLSIPKTEKELLTECYEFMKSRSINSISDIENLLARLN